METEEAEEDVDVERGRDVDASTGLKLLASEVKRE
jgi:hypothetical protein